ncbi:MAG: sulfite exporter TauE/SafE family protein [Chloroflexi bacterium]|nr:sulfite exporter TauE/SafE family protein [Chloroflexota bacterium]
MDLRELALNWYSFVAGISGMAGEPLMALSDTIGLPIVAAVLLGLLGATSPCQVTTNASALAIVSRRLDTPYAPVRSALAYLLGKALVYTILGAAVVLVGRELATGSIPIIVIARKALGVLMVLIGLFFLGVLRPQVSIGHRLSAWLQDRATGGGWRATFLLGGAFGFAFCPTLFWLFFGLTIPMALRSPLGVLYAPAFALGTTLPLLGLVGLLALGVRQTAGYAKGVQRANKLLQRGAGVVLLLAGVNDIFVYWIL